MIGRQVRRQFRHVRERVAGLERRQDAFELRAELKRRQRLGVGDGYVLDPPDVVQPGVLRPDSRIVEARRDRMRVIDLTVIVLQQVGAVAVQHAGPPRRERSRMAPGLDALPACFDADQADVGVVQERMKQTHRVGAAADAGDQRVRQPSFGLQDLLPHLVADHGLEVADQRRVRMRPATVPMM